jgi:hypothetical protein
VRSRLRLRDSAGYAETTTRKVLLQSGKKKMDLGDRNRQLVKRVREDARDSAGRVRLAVEDAAWFMREHFVWPVEDSLDRLGRRGAIGVFGGGGVAVVGVVAALLIAGSGGSGSSAGTTEAFVTPQRAPTTPAPAVVTPAPTPKPKPEATKPTGPTLHGAAPDFAPAQDVQSGVGDGKAVAGKPSASDAEGPAARGADAGAASAGGAADGAANGSTGGAASGGASAATGASDEAITSSNDNPASTAKIGATPEASASAQAQASSLEESAGVAETGAGQNGAAADEAAEPSGPPAPKAAKQVARRFAEAFVVYEVGGVDTKVRKAFKQTSTKQLSRSLLQRPPRQPANVKVPQAKVVNVVAGPSKGEVYTLSVSLLRVGVTSELRIQMEQGVGKKWQVTNVFG